MTSDKKLLITCVLFFAFIDLLAAQSINWLPSWNEGVAKQAILNFVQETCDPSSQNYVPPADRIATFDQDGTLWVEHPLYTQAVFALDRLKELASQHPQWQSEQPFKAVIAGDNQVIGKFVERDWEKIIAATHVGMSTDSFVEIVKQWLATARHPRFKRLYIDLIYSPYAHADVEKLISLTFNNLKNACHI